MGLRALQNIHEKYIKGTEKESFVASKKILLCYLTYAVKRRGNLSSNNVYVSTKMLKHIYDKKPAEQYDFIVQNLYTIVRYPDWIYRNRSGKRGDFCLVKELKNKKYLCSIEDRNIKEINIATVFRTDDKYLKKYELLWSWKDGIPSS